MTQDWELLRTTFDTSAAFFDEARPGYPDALFDDLVQLSAIPPRGRILEIACGTGKATVPLACRGFRILCLEPGTNLAAIARRNLGSFPTVEVCGRRFEDWEIEAGAFDLVVAATSIGWVAPEVRRQKTADALRSGGCLAVFWNQHVRIPGQDHFFEAVQDIYRRHAPQVVERPRLPHELPTTIEPGLFDTGLFEEVAVKHYPWGETYVTNRYLRLLLTFSGHIVLPEETRQRLLEDIGALIDREFGGRIVKHQVAVLQLARRKGP